MPGTIITQTRWIAALAAVAACGGLTAPPAVSNPPPTSAVVPTTATTLDARSVEAPTEPPPTVALDAGETDPDVRRQNLESMLKPLWFGWYSAVASGDPDDLDRTVARNRVHIDGIEAIEEAALRFAATPAIDDYEFAVLDVLRDEDDCIVASLREDPGAFLIDGVVAERIGVFWPNEGSWFLATSWAIDTPEFAWADDCTLMVRDFA
jgi:hypothetical protein